MDMQSLTRFLGKGTVAMDAAEEEEVIVPAPVPEAMATIVVEEPVEDKFQTLKASLMAIGWLAKDLHYRAKDRSFYGNHLLADLIYVVSDNTDKINEVYYLGERMMPPPMTCTTAHKAVKMLFGMNESREHGEMEIARRLLLFLESAIHTVEWIKDEHKDLKSGTVAVLDGISEELLKDAGLLRRVVAPESEEKPAEGEVVVAVAEADPITAYLDMDKGEGETE